MKKLVLLFLIVSISFLVLPKNTYALDNTHFDNSKFISIIDVTKDELKDMTSNYKKEHNCNSLLGDPVNDPDSVAWLLQYVFNIIKVVGPLLVVVLSSIDFARVIVKSDDDEMAKARKKLVTRLVLAMLLFFVPTLAMVLLQVFGLTTDPTCGLQ